MTTDNAQLARIEQKLDSLDERLFNGGTGVITTLSAEQKDTRAKVAELTTSQAVARAESRKDAKWIASLGTVAGAIIGFLIHILGGK